MIRQGFIFLYLDPGTGSLIIQLVIAAVTGAFFFLKKVRSYVAAFFNQFRKKTKETND
jgi:hypothetical protein